MVFSHGLCPRAAADLRAAEFFLRPGPLPYCCHQLQWVEPTTRCCRVCRPLRLRPGLCTAGVQGGRALRAADGRWQMADATIHSDRHFSPAIQRQHPRASCQTIHAIAPFVHGQFRSRDLWRCESHPLHGLVPGHAQVQVIELHVEHERGAARRPMLHQGLPQRLRRD